MPASSIDGTLDDLTVRRFHAGALIASGALAGLGLMMWIAANWAAFGKWGRFGIVAAALAASAAGAASSPKARMALSLTGVMSIGALFALIGQTYQTGADPWQLFALWGALALPWVLAARSDAVWCLWVLVAFTALGLYWGANLPANWLQQPEQVLPVWLAAFAIAGALSPWSGLDDVIGATPWAYRLAAVSTALFIAAATLPAILDDKGSSVLVLAGFAVTIAAVAAISFARPLDIPLLAVFAFTFDVLLISSFAYVLFLQRGAHDETMSMLIVGVIAAIVVAATAAAIVAIGRRAAEGASSAEAARPHAAAALGDAHPQSWAVVAMTSFGAIMAAVPFIMFLGMTFGVWLENGPGPYVIGAAILAVALGLLRTRANLGFGQQFGIIALLTALVLIGFALYRDAPSLAAHASILIIAAGLLWILPDDWTAAIAGAIAGTFAAAFISDLSYLAHNLHLDLFANLKGPGTSYAAILAAAVLLASSSPRFSPAVEVGPRLGRFLSGWIAATLLLVIYASGDTFLFGGGLGLKSNAHASAIARLLVVFNAHTLIRLLVTAAACAWFWQRYPGLRTPVGAAAIVLALALTLLASHLAAPLLVLAAALAAGRKSLVLFAAFTIIWIIGGFYYWLGWPLTAKAYLMLVLAISLAAAAWFSNARLPGIAAANETVTPSRAIAATLILISAAATAIAAAQAVRQKENILASGQRVYLTLAPVDPRSLVQGDYMALRFALPQGEAPEVVPGEPALQAVVAVDGAGIGTVARYARAGETLKDGELGVNLARKHGRWMLATDAWYFEEGQAERYAGARYGELRVSPDGEALLIGLAGADLRPLD